MPNKPLSSFDVERAVREHLRQMGNKRLVSQQARQEIEDHLRDEIEDLIAHGHAPKDAAERAFRAFGSGADILAEYGKVYGGHTLAQLGNLSSYYFDRRVVMRLSIGFFLAIFFLIAGLLFEGGNISSVLAITSLMIVAGGAVGRWARLSSPIRRLFCVTA